MSHKFELYKDKAGEFRFRLKAANGQNIGASEGYKARASALNGIESVRKNSANEARFTVKQNEKTTKWYFNLKAGNGEIIMQSQAYASEATCRNGIASTQKGAASAEMIDQTNA